MWTKKVTDTPTGGLAYPWSYFDETSTFDYDDGKGDEKDLIQETLYCDPW